MSSTLNTSGVNTQSSGQGNLDSLKHQVIQQAASEGTSHLHHVQAPNDGISQGVKQAYLADHQGSGKQRGNKCANCKCGDNCQCGSSCNTKCQ